MKGQLRPRVGALCCESFECATVVNDRFRLLLRGAMGLNFDPRLEQIDLTAGGESFEAVKRVEAELPILKDGAADAEAYAAGKVIQAFGPEQLAAFRGIKPWVK